MARVEGMTGVQVRILSSVSPFARDPGSARESCPGRWRVPPPQPPPAAADRAEHVLVDVARHRHGDTAVLRALSRRERASAAVLQVL